MRTNVKKIFAVLLTVALVATMFVMPANAAKKTYSDVLENSVFNGDFEIGVEGMSPYGWEFKSIESNTKFSTDRDFTNGRLTLTTVTDGNNKVAQIRKVKEGYAAMGSQAISVVGGKQYQVSFDYKVVETNFTKVNNCTVDTCKANGECCFMGHWMGVVTMMRQFDANGNLLNANGNIETAVDYTQPIYVSGKNNALGRDGVMSDYETVSFNVTLNENTTSVKLYIGIGAFNSTYPAVNIDNVNFVLDSKVMNNKTEFNGDFENVTYTAAGGKAYGIAGPSEWYSYGFDGYGMEIGTAHTNYGAATYQLVTKTEIDKNGNLNRYAEYSLIPKLAVGGDRADKDTKFYNYTCSNQIKVPVAAGKTFTVNFKYKSYTMDGSNTIVHGSYANKTTFTVTFYDANGQHLATALGGGTTNRNNCQKVISLVTENAVSDWTDYSLTVTVPNLSIAAAYYTVGFTQAVNRNQGMTTDAVNAVYCFDDITIEYTETEAGLYQINGIEEMSVDTTGYPRADNFTGSWALRFVEDENRGTVYQISGSDSAKASANKNSTGYITYWIDDLISVTEGTKVKVAFDSKIDGYAEGIAHQQSLDKYVNTSGANSYQNTGIKQWQLGENARISIRYFNDAGEVIYATNDGTILTANGLVARVTSDSREDYDWKHFSGDVIVPTGAVKLQYGFMAFGYSRVGSALAEHYFDNIVVKPAADSYWTSEEYFKRDVTDMFFLMFNGGNANGDTTVDLVDLVRLNNKLNDTADAVEANINADMNKNGKLDSDDLTLLRWKLLGLDTEEKLNTGIITEKNILKDKTFLFCGDSITAATSANNGKSWAAKTGDLAGALTTNYAKGGSTFIDMTTASPARGRIVNQIRDNAGDYDYLIFNGGVNDTGRADLGTLSDSYDINDIDQSTIIGSMEAACYYAHTLYPNAKIGYIVTYRNRAGTSSLDATMGAAKQVCEKWNIPYIDLYDGTVIVDGEELSYSLDILKIATREYFAVPDDPGDVHIAEIGYDVIMPYILDWIYTLTDNVSPIPAK